MGKTPSEITDPGTGCTLKQVKHNSTQRTAIRGPAACAGVRSGAGESLSLGWSVRVSPQPQLLFAGRCCLPSTSPRGRLSPAEPFRSQAFGTELHVCFLWLCLLNHMAFYDKYRRECIEQFKERKMSLAEPTLMENPFPFLVLQPKDNWPALT